MNVRTYTLKEAVFALNRSGTVEEASRLTRHLRHWTSMDLLKTEGKKHTGTGRSREYSADTIRRAAVLVELARWRVPMTVLADAFATFTDDSEAEWEKAVADDVDGPVYLTMTWSDEGSEWWVQRDFPLAHLIEENIGEEETREPEPVRDGQQVHASIIVINLSRLLRWVKL